MKAGQLKKFGQKWVNYGKNWAKTYAIASVTEAERLLSKRMWIGLGKYYSYAPQYYQRTSNLWHNAFEPYHYPKKLKMDAINKKNNYSVEGGIKLNSDYLKPYSPKGISMQSIYYQAMHLGKHGSELVGTPNSLHRQDILTLPSPYDWTEKYLHSSSFINQVMNKGRSAADKIQTP